MADSGVKRLPALDVAVAAAVTAVLVLLTLAQPATATTAVDAPVWVRCLVAAGVGLPLALRRRHPVGVYCVVLAVSLLSLFVNTAKDSFLAAAFVLYTVALERPGHRWTLFTGLAAVGAAGVLGVSGSATPYWWMNGPGLIPFGWAVMVCGWIAGRAGRERRAYAVRAAEEHAARAVAEERMHIARELHDVVAHSMGVIAVQAGIANYVRAGGGGDARLGEALQVIEATSRGALAEIRRLLEVLRAEDGPDGVPKTGLSALPGLVERAAAAGVTVRTRIDLDRPLPEGVELAVYRIVQEALTNVVKHAGPVACRVDVEASGHELRVEIVDDGPPCSGAPAGEPGHGLRGMRERVMMYGGELAADPCPGGGFAVRARIPL
ncbi:sensor histidine kinase [Dactylosporangium sp. AC04546]|uniref:sensor histidine kinase n=1 Tax=Dactylosporangium sp. AC04546 TaxID=2862460 RepID=UPI002E7AFF29|nr:sensor histidine kinase [Dactylosporangium sp. AC04546]WVK78711.1 sensor histidine kinase [Dactylosporangium sp. AC04546]